MKMMRFDGRRPVGHRVAAMRAEDLRDVFLAGADRAGVVEQRASSPTLIDRSVLKRCSP
jgi:hypothetical protein